MSKTIAEAKKTLTKSIIFRGSFNAAFQRNSIYHTKIENKKDAKEFKTYLKNKLYNLLEHIKASSNYTEANHFKTISQFSQDVEKKMSVWLKEGKFNIGTSQKLINVYWKMSWVLQKGVPTPVHCPFDGIIIKGLDNTVNKMSWTKMNSIKQYKLFVNAANRESQGKSKSIAEWELIHYNTSNGFVEI